MIKINKLKKGWFALKKGDMLIKTIFNEWKIWLTSKEIQKLFWIDKNIIIENIKNILSNSQFDIEKDIEKIVNEETNKKETFYSLDIIISLWYRFKLYKNTKFLVNSNTILKNYTKKTQTNLNKFKYWLKTLVTFFKKDTISLS